MDVNLTSFANGTYTIQFFASTTCDPSGHGEGERLIGHFTGHGAPATSQLFLNEAVPAGQFITATATDANGNTSEFSACTQVDPASPIVTNTNDSGAGSLRQAITDANATPGTETITFNIPGVTPATPAVINVASPLPTISESVVIDATTQPGYDGTPVVELRSPSTATGWTGLNLNAPNIAVRGLSITQFGDGILAMQPHGGHVIELNLIGTNRSFAAGLGNTRGVQWRGTGSTIQQNVISGNGEGMNFLVGAAGNQIAENHIGLLSNGTSLGNSGTGVTMFDGASGNTFTSNLIGGNGGWGVDLQFSGAPVSNTVFRSNIVGLNANGNDAGNFLGGIRLDHAPGTQIGAPGFRNVISGNGGNLPQQIGVGIQVLGTVTRRR